MILSYFKIYNLPISVFFSFNLLIRRIADVEAELELCASLKHQYICELEDVISGLNQAHDSFLDQVTI